MSSSVSPTLGVYAAIRMDPTAMVAHLDAQAAEEARGIQPKTYLILTAFVCLHSLELKVWLAHAP